jgi:hypothetical protein
MPDKKLDKHWILVNRMLCWIVVILLCAIALDMGQVFRAALS